MSKNAFKFLKMIERRIHIAEREGDEYIELMLDTETYKMVLEEILQKLLEKQYKVEFYYNPILFCDELKGDYRLTISGFDE